MAKSKTAAQSVHARAETQVPDLGTVLEANGAALAAAIKAGEAMLHGVAAMNSEMLNFAGERMRKSLETSESLMGCHDPAQAFNVQCEHARKATQAYLEEATRLMSLAAKVSEDCLQPIESRARETLGALHPEK